MSDRENLIAAYEETDEAPSASLVDSETMADSATKMGISSQTLVSNDVENFGKARHITQYVAAIAVTLGAFATGTILAWTSPANGALEDKSAYNFPVNDSQLGWIGSLMTLGAAAVCFPMSIMMDLIGRKLTMLTLIIPFTVGWCLIIWAESVTMLYIGRFITGMAGGAFCVSAPLYTSEIAQNEIRGRLGSYFQLMVTLGILFVYIVGAYVELFTLSIICMVVPLVFGICFVFQPETAVYYVKKNKIDSAKKSLQYFRGPEYDIDKEIQMLVELNEQHNTNDESILKALFTRASLLAILISFGLMTFQQLSGVNAVIFYTTSIFKDAGVSISPSLATIIVGAMQVVATFISTLVVDKLGRRILLLLSASVMALSTTTLGVYFYLSTIETREQLAHIGWLPVLSLCVFIIVFSIGFGPVPWMMVSEVVPKEVKSIVTPSACTFNWLLAFVVTKFFGNLTASLGADWTFWLFSIMSYIGTVFVFFIIPETKGKSLDQIQRELSGKARDAPAPQHGQVNEAYMASENI